MELSIYFFKKTSQICKIAQIICKKPYISYIFFEKEVDICIFLRYNINVVNLIHRGIAQLVEQWSPKPCPYVRMVTQ